MTWGKVIDTRRSLAVFFIIALALVLGLVLTLSVLANIQVISTNSDPLLRPLSMLSQLF